MELYREDHGPNSQAAFVPTEITAASCLRSTIISRFASLPLVDSGLGVIVPPVKPVIFQGRDPVQALTFRGAGDGATLKVPFARSGRVQEQPGFLRGWSI